MASISSIKSKINNIGGNNTDVIDALKEIVKLLADIEERLERVERKG